MFDELRGPLAAELAQLREAGLYKRERVLTTPQGARITADGRELLNFCANNYLGLSAHPQVIAAAHEAIATHGFGLSSVRFICGTQDLHRRLERAIADFVGAEDAILYAAAFDANGGLFEPLLGEEDAIVSDALNHASIIDGIRLSKARRYRYRNNELDDLEAQLKAARAAGCRRLLVATDGVFSMDGIVAQLDGIVPLAERYGAMVMIDDCHATGFVGPNGRGTHELHGVMDRIDIVTGTFGKALGGASGGFTAGRREIVELLRQRSRPYLFSNTLMPAIAGATLRVMELLRDSPQLRQRLADNTTRFRAGMAAAGFELGGAGRHPHPICPVMLGDARRAGAYSEALLDEGIYAIGFSYPVVPQGKARIRIQLSAAHEPEQVDQAVQAFIRVRQRLG